MLEQRIATYLGGKLPDAVDITIDNLHRIPGGQSRETWSFDARWRQNGGDTERGFILRRDPDASLLESDRTLEFRVMDAVHRQGIPTPEMFWLEEDTAHLDRPFCLMQRIDDCETSPQKVLLDPALYPVRHQISDDFVSILARIHALDVDSLGLDAIDVPLPDQCGMREVAQWEAIVEKESLEPQPVLRASFRWMRRHLPKPAQRIVLVHADYRTGNFLAHRSGEIRGILDWEMTHIGDPLEDIAWACIRPWRWLGNELIGGLMDRSDFYAKYEAASGLTVDEESVRFWEVLGNVKLAAIFITGARSFCEGRTKSAMMAVLGRNVQRLELEVMDLMGV